MKAVQTYPIPAALLALISGILISTFSPSIFWSIFIIAIPLFLFLAFSNLYGYSVKGGAILSVFIVFGFALNHFNQPQIAHPNELNGYVLSISNIDSSSVYKKGIGTIIHTSPHQENLHLKKVRIYTKSQLRIGTYAIASSPEIIPPPTNPDVFNFRAHSFKQDIYYQHFVREKNLKFLTTRAPSFLSSVRSRGLNAITAYFPNQEVEAVMQSLVFGYKNNLEPETKEAFKDSGAMHILAVSGLHVGILYQLLVFLFSFLRKRKSLIWIQTLIIISGIWCYAALADFPVSVVRASLMFSCLTCNKVLRGRGSSVSALAIAALFILIWDPNALFSVGFQLSFLAVLSIILVYPILEPLFSPKSRLGTWTWQLVVVSLSAQIGIFPLIIYYFHQFPIYFILTNFIAIPGAAIMLWGALLSIAFGWIAFVGTFITSAVNFLASMIISSIHFISNLPYAVIDQLYIDWWECILLYIWLMLIWLFFKVKNYIYFKYAFASFVLLFLSLSIQKVISLNSKEILVYDIPRHAPVSFIEKKKGILLNADGLTPKQVKFNIQPHFDKNQIFTTLYLNPSSTRIGQNEIGVWNGLSYIILRNEAQLPKIETPIDLLVIDTPYPPNLELVTNSVNTREIVSRHHFKNLKASVHNLPVDGYYSKIW